VYFLLDQKPQKNFGPHSMNILIEIMLWMAAGYVFMSFFEWWIHSTQMHKKGWANRFETLFEVHQHVHHPAYKHDYQIPHPEHHRDNGVFMPVLKNVLVAAVVFSPVALAGYWMGFACLTGFVLLHALAWNFLHPRFHSPSTWWVRSRVFRFFRDYHHTHHLRPNRNYNIVCLGADFLLGTFMRLSAVRPGAANTVPLPAGTSHKTA